MFRKIVSNLSFSPALVGQLGFYAKRLRKEETTRRAGLIFVALALVVQCLAVFQPPEAANASGATDFVSGGLGLGANRSINNFLNPYDTNATHLQDIMNYMGISRQEIASAQYGSFIVGNKISWGREARFSYAQGERQVNITNASGQVVLPIYAKPMKLNNSANLRIYAWIGHSSRVGWFALMQACGNLVTDIIPPPPPPPVKYCTYNGAILADSADCKGCPGNVNIWYKDATCIPNIVKSKTAVNNTQGGVDATTVTANGGDKITYTVTVQNTGLLATSVELQEPLKDVLEYANVTDAGGGTLDPTTKTLSWPTIQLAPGVKEARTFSVTVIDPVPATAQGVSDPTSYDCTMINVFGNAVTIKVTCPTPKVVEQVVTQLPHTGPTENLIFAGVVLAVVTYFYARARQVGKEVRLIRRDLNSGTI
ncbi:DUF11 domain-containing protein [Patescibacteria group bacterium]|nr:MAG: DUF11 domain-containing protein [Patescibacteria group bacterium]